jgi:Delta3,5-Delta2,4-dienoyl-CoA isomerase
MHGHALGLAINIASCADIRICTQTTRFAAKEVDIGIAADHGTLSRLPKAVGSVSWVKDVCFSAREFGAAEAQRVGFVSAVLETKEAAIAEAIRMASVIAKKSPAAIQGTKVLINWSRDRSVEDGLKHTAVWTAAAVQRADVMAGIQKGGLRLEKL